MTFEDETEAHSPSHTLSGMAGAMLVSTCVACSGLFWIVVEPPHTHKIWGVMGLAVYATLGTGATLCVGVVDPIRRLRHHSWPAHILASIGLGGLLAVIWSFAYGVGVKIQALRIYAADDWVMRIPEVFLVAAFGWVVPTFWSLGRGVALRRGWGFSREVIAIGVGLLFAFVLGFFALIGGAALSFAIAMETSSPESWD